MVFKVKRILVGFIGGPYDNTNREMNERFFEYGFDLVVGTEGCYKKTDDGLMRWYKFDPWKEVRNSGDTY